ncbi:DHH family phosphoesterase [Desulfovibrio sp. OttesenSCG-928-G15]|nr:DHH family phosphoesterase [Desulfovibrio sp. OttesenSCG-928-G15]
MKLSDLVTSAPVAIQCHNAPDADALACGYALYCYFRSRGMEPLFFYGGAAALSKPDLLLMVKLLDIPVHHRPELKEWSGLLVTVDCQYLGGNVQRVQADDVAVIDHHKITTTLPEKNLVNPYLGSCATVIWKMFQEEGFALDAAHRKLAIALYYGLYMDTQGFEEIRHPEDLNMRDTLTYIESEKLIQEEPALRTLLTSNLSIQDLSVAVKALGSMHVDEEREFALIGADPCDQNILGYLSDMVIRVAGITTAIVWTPQGDNFRFSIRTSGKLARADDVVSWITQDGAGEGGGHKDKCGGRLYAEAVFSATGIKGNAGVQHFLEARLTAYAGAYTIIDRQYPRKTLCDSMAPYRKKTVTVGYVPSEDLAPAGTRLCLRMLEGDAVMTVSPDLYCMIGIRGEVYFMSRTAFEQTYTPLEAEPYHRPPAVQDYEPTVFRLASGERLTLFDNARPCRSLPDTRTVRALQLIAPTKLFPAWDESTYILGKAGDWLVMQHSDPYDLYLIKEDVFPQLYEPCALQSAELS